ncbi:hypothetical protein D3C84_1270090 [compost metagenome]
MEREIIKGQIEMLSEKTNSNFGRHSGVWDLLGKKQKELKEIDEILKTLKL